MQIRIEIGNKKHEKYATIIAEMIERAAQKKEQSLPLENLNSYSKK